MSFARQRKSYLAVEREVQRAENILATGRMPSLETIREQFKLIAKANHPDHGGCGSGIYTIALLQAAKKTLIEDLERRNG